MIDFGELLTIAFVIMSIVLIVGFFKEKFKEHKTYKVSKEYFSIIAIVWVLRSFLFEPFLIPSGSMNPSLVTGDFILVKKFEYGLNIPLIYKNIVKFDSPKQGEVVIFKNKELGNKTYIKRVIATPGDTFFYDFAKKSLYVNGEIVKKEFIENSTSTIVTESGEQEVPTVIYNQEIGGKKVPVQELDLDLDPDIWLSQAKFSSPVVLPEGKYIMMGDNRDNSFDSRFWGFVDEDYILGRPFYVWLHMDKLFAIPNFKRNHSIK